MCMYVERVVRRYEGLLDETYLFTVHDARERRTTSERKRGGFIVGKRYSRHLVRRRRRRRRRQVMKVFQDDGNRKADGQDKREKERENALRVIQPSSQAIARRKSDADSLKPVQSGRSTSVSSSTHAVAAKEMTKKMQVEESSAAADDEVSRNTTQKLSQASPEMEKENTSALRNGTTGTDRFPLAAQYGINNITSSRGAVDNVAMNAWRVQKENASLKFTLHQMRHEMACLQTVRI